MSLGSSFLRWDMTARVLVKSTRASRPSSADRSRTLSPVVDGGNSLAGVLVAEFMDGTCGACSDSEGVDAPKYDASFLVMALCAGGM